MHTQIHAHTHIHLAGYKWNKHIVKNMNKHRISALEKLLKPKSSPKKSSEEDKIKYDL